MKIRLREEMKNFIHDCIQLISLERFISENKRYPKYLICNHHLGDTAIACSYAKSFKEVTNVNICIITKPQYEKIPKIFGLDSIAYKIPSFKNTVEEGLKQIFLNIMNFTFRNNVYFSLPGVLQFFKVSRKEIWSNMYIRYEKTFGLNQKLQLKRIEEKDLPEISSFQELIEKMKIQKGKSVIISPDSKSMSPIDTSFIERIYENLSKEGICPIINSDNPFWQRKGFRNFFTEPSALLTIINFAGFSISARSGVSDLVSFLPNSINIVIYSKDCPNDFLFESKKDELFGEIKEFFIEINNQEILIEEIIGFIKDKISSKEK